MTQDAITEANSLASQLQAAQQKLSTQLNVIKTNFADASADQIAALNAAVHAIYDQSITDLQTRLTNLSGDYTNS